MLSLKQILYRISQQDVALEMKIERGDLTTVKELRQYMYVDKNRTGDYLRDINAHLTQIQTEIFERLSAKIEELK